MKTLYSFIQKIDWVLMIRLMVAGLFISIAIAYKDWLPAIFGLTIFVTGLIAHKTKRGCGYTNCQ
ncbi:MAG: hypothetical protein ACK4S0_05470 [Sediminibacterium sp.]|nr:hypothetical protein [uncultured Sediminibacterium sp.]